MYTVMFNRQSYQHCSDYNPSPSRFEMHYFESIKEVEKYIKYTVREQERIDRDYRSKNIKYYLGDYGFMVLKNGVLVSSNTHYSICFDESVMPEMDEDEIVIDVYQLCASAVKTYGNFAMFCTKFINEEEKLLAKAHKEEMEKLRLEMEYHQERSLLKELLAKHPDMR